MGIFSFLCLAWTTITEVVCVAWNTVVEVVCVAWAVIATTVCVVWDAVVTAVSAVLTVLESFLGFVLSLFAVLIELIFAIPVVGRILEWLWNVALLVAWSVVALIDGALYAVGIRPQKKLRVCTVIDRNEAGNPVATVAQAVTMLNDAIVMFHSGMNVQILNSAPFQFSSGFSSTPGLADASWVSTLASADTTDMLDVRCGVAAVGEDLLTVGSRYKLRQIKSCYFGAWRRVTGLGAPVTVMILRSIDGGLTAGCSLGPLNDYVTIATTQAATPADTNGDGLPDTPGLMPPFVPSPDNVLAHEIGHASNLLHVVDPTNLMSTPRSSASGIYDPQAIHVRTSRHVSYL